ncbi:M1 family metallopeptidase [Nocardioides sp. TF02-7]|uniref:M1 family metallopeptidase n=1 Tax=Nocardioides sp. TF02-7 TaxID=2917724 RepID=UPI001F06EF65|nr:M1 family metallopeptidase [Nocardioides sp. TF02-7]UMG92999.1 M1 family metallopeptidase [Nocardioides sp. TF02-7]
MPHPRLLARLLAPLLTTVLVATLVAGSSAAPPDEPEVPDRYFPQDGNPGYDVLHYDIRTRYKFGSGLLTGTTVVRLRPRQDLAALNLDLLLAVDDVRVDGRPARFRKQGRHELRVVPARPLVAGETTRVRVRYHGRPGNITWRDESSWLADRREVVTMNEPHMAPWWFPSNDHPSDKATYDIRVTVPREKKVISNGRQVSRRVHGPNATTHWRMSDRMATYLAFFAAGDFLVERGKAAGIPYVNAASTLNGRRWARRALAALRPSARITASLQRELGDYPFQSTGGLVTGLPVGFALENQGRPTYGSIPGRSLLVHELAHQWFGNSVSVGRWRDIWLNEGFATYLEQHDAEARGGRSTSRWLRGQYDAWRSESWFWDVVVANPCTSPCRDTGRIFAWPIYQRGGMALAALRNVIGKSAFRTLLRTWVRDHRDGNAHVEDFEALAEEVAGTDLDAFFDAWLRDRVPPPRQEAFGF